MGSIGYIFGEPQAAFGSHPPRRPPEQRLDAEMAVKLKREADRVIERHAPLGYNNVSADSSVVAGRSQRRGLISGVKLERIDSRRYRGRRSEILEICVIAGELHPEITC
jgi:hypothetical protein